MNLTIRNAFYLFGQPSDGKELDFEFSLEDLETVKVIGKGSGGVVQLVQHKWVGKLFALKVISQQNLILFITFLHKGGLCGVLRSPKITGCEVPGALIISCVLTAGYSDEHTRGNTQANCAGIEDKPSFTMPSRGGLLSFFLS